MSLNFAQQENIGFRYVVDALRCDSPYGDARVRKLRFYASHEKDALLEDLGNVCTVMDTFEECAAEYGRIERLMMQLKDIRRSVERCAEGPLNEVELFEVKRFLLQTELIAPVFAQINAKAQLSGIEIIAQSEALKLLDLDGQHAATFFIPDAYSQVLRAARKEKRLVEEELRRAKTEAERAPLMAERARLAAAEDEEERVVRAALSEALRPFLPGILACMDALGMFDFTLARARLARRYGGVMPELTDGALDMQDMVNPRIVDALTERKRTFTPVSIEAGKGATVITGANMGGKSVALKTIALNAFALSAGILPFAKRARMPLFDGVHIVSEDLENVDRGLSSFGAEIVRFNEVLSDCGLGSGKKPEGLHMILLDEFARGTNPEEGAMIVRAVTRYLNRQDAVTVLTTHYDGVAQEASLHYEVVGLRDMDTARVKGEIALASPEAGADVIAAHMNYGLYRVEREQGCPRDALNICRLLSLTEEILSDIETLY